MMEEEWKSIEGYEGLYDISSFGKVRSLDRWVECGNDGKRKNYYVHRLVAEAFIPKERNKDFVNHLDRDRSNNRVDNLEWCTAKENAVYSVPYRKKRNLCKHGTYGYGIRRKKNGFEVGIDKKYLGRYKTYEEAAKVRDDYLKRELGDTGDD